MKYVRLCHGVKDKGQLLSEDDVLDNITSESDYYQSIYYYNEDQYTQFQKLGTVKGIKSVVTNKLVFDFDNKDNPDLARDEAKKLVVRLIQAGIKEENFQFYFSGNKGFNVVVTFNRWFTVAEVRALVEKYTKDLKIDRSLYDAPQILRIPGTKHPESKLYKIPLMLKEFMSMPLETIKLAASSLDNVYGNYNFEVATPPKEFFEIGKKELVKMEKVESVELDLTKRPSHWKSCKWSLLQGNFNEGERHNALLIIAATAKGLGYDENSVYYLCKSALKKEAMRTGREEFPKEELWENIIEGTVFKPDWQGGQFSCKTDPWLKNYCESLGINGCKHDTQETTKPIASAYNFFEDYAENIDVLTVKTGISELDRHVRLTVGMLVGLVAPAASGKTSIAIQMLNSMSNANGKCLFFSYDMYEAMIFQKLVQRHFNMSGEEIFRKFKDKDVKFKNTVMARLSAEYKNVEFCFSAGQSIEGMIDTIEEVNEKFGEKVRFIVVDYNELIISDKSESTAASAYVIQSLRAIASKYNCCVLVLLQPNKLNANPSEEFTTYQAAKGSSSIAQAVSVMLGVNRPGYDPRHPNDDKFLTIKGLKNRMGSLFSLDMHWDGLTGAVRSLTIEEREQLKVIMERKLEERLKDTGWA